MKNAFRQKKDCPYTDLLLNRQPLPTGHLDKCEVCRELATLLYDLSPGIDVEILQPTPEAVRRHSAIPNLLDEQKPSPELTGTVAFDSWNQRPGRTLRDPGPGAMRRIRMEGAGTTLELLAQRLRGVWEMTARVYENSRPSVRWVLYAGPRKITPGVLGFYHWNSKAMPRLFRLQNSTFRLRFERNE